MVIDKEYDQLKKQYNGSNLYPKDPNERPKEINVRYCPEQEIFEITRAQKRLKAQFLVKMRNIISNGRKMTLTCKLEKWLFEYAEENCHQREGETMKQFENRKQKLIRDLIIELDNMVDSREDKKRKDRVSTVLLNVDNKKWSQNHIDKFLEK